MQRRIQPPYPFLLHRSQSKIDSFGAFVSPTLLRVLPHSAPRFDARLRGEAISDLSSQRLVLGYDLLVVISEATAAAQIR
jgi:hypothetical protein